MPAGTNLRTTASTPWRVPAKYSTRACPRSRIACVQRVPFVHVQERLVLRIVREQDCGHRDHAGRGRRLVAQVQPNRLPIWQHVGIEPRRIDNAPVRLDPQSRREDPLQGRHSAPQQAGVEQLFRRSGVQIVAGVEHVHDEAGFDSAPSMCRSR